MKYKLTRLNFVLFSVLSYFSFGLTTSFAEPPKMMGNNKHRPTFNLPIEANPKQDLYLDTFLESTTALGHGTGLNLRLGIQKELLGFDLGIRAGKMQFSDFFSSPTATEQGILDATPSGNGNPNAEINRVRTGSDSWSYTMIEPGISVTGKMLPYFLQKWSQTARFGIAKASFKDSANSLSYNGWLLRFEALARYHFSSSSSVSVHGGLASTFGWITRENPGATQKNEATLPVHYLNYVCGVRITL